jgi:hypothetical protein
MIGLVCQQYGLSNEAAGVPSGYLAMALTGGGLMLAQLAYETWRPRRAGHPAQ